MKIKNRLLGSLSLIAVMSVVSLASVSAATTPAGPKKSSSNGFQAGIFYSPSMINGKIDVSNPENYTPTDGGGGLKDTVDFKDHTKFAWLGGGAKVGYKMGNIVISAVTNYRMTDYYLDNDNKSDDFTYSKDDNGPSKSVNADPLDGTAAAAEYANNAGTALLFKDVSKWYTGIDVDYIIGISKEMSASVGAGVGMEYNSMNIEYANSTVTNMTDVTAGSGSPSDYVVIKETKLTALPFVMQGNVGFGYKISPNITPYVGYTLRYAFEADLNPKEDTDMLAIRVKYEGSMTTATPEDEAKDIISNVKLPMKLQSNIDHIFKIGVNFTF